jgi:glycosyltransferase involved in cell wall biosynthesis
VKIAIVTVQVPFITGGAEILAESLLRELRARRHEAEIVTIPFKWYPPERILDCMAMARLMDLTEVNGQCIDKVIALKFPAYYVEHPDKVCWILHQHRQAYELFGTPYGDLHHDERGERVAAEIKRWDGAFLPQSRKLFTIAKTVTERLRTYNQITADPLYHPPTNYQNYHCAESSDYILYAGRFDTIKRQHLLVEALAQTKTPAKAVIIGPYGGAYGKQVLQTIEALGLQDRVQCLGTVDEEKKLDLYAHALGVYNGVYQEDYGYVTLEAFFASKPVITHSDSGGPLEFVRHGENGYVVTPRPKEIAKSIDKLYRNQQRAREMGEAGNKMLNDLEINWDTVIEKLLS